MDQANPPVQINATRVLEEVEEEGSLRIPVKALLDSGSLAGDFISRNIIDKLNASKYITYVNTTICSGFDNHCMDKFPSILLDLSFKNEVTFKTEFFKSQVLILEKSSIDLIIGRATLKLQQFSKKTPSHFEEMKKLVLLQNKNLEEFGDSVSQDLLPVQQTILQSSTRTPLGVSVCTSCTGLLEHEPAISPSVKIKAVRGGDASVAIQPLCSCLGDTSGLFPGAGPINPNPGCPSLETRKGVTVASRYE